MPQKNLKEFSADAFLETAETLKSVAAELEKVSSTMGESGMKSVPVAHHANFQEALRRIMVFIGNANEQVAMEKLKKHFD